MTTKTKQAAGVYLRWCIRKDMPQILAIESEAFEYPWTDDDFIRCLRQRNCIAMVAEAEERVVGFFVYELHKFRLHILDFAVHHEWRGKGVGRQMIEKLIGKLYRDRRSRIYVEVREQNLDAQLFFRAVGFKAVGVLRNFYDQCDDSAYSFMYRYQ